MSATLIIGLGNPILGDDGVGWRVAEEVRARLGTTDPAVEIDCLSLGGLRLMERMLGYDRVIVIDSVPVEAIETVASGPGHIGPETREGFPLQPDPDEEAPIGTESLRGSPVGTVFEADLSALRPDYAGHSTSAHDTCLRTALEIARLLGASVPDEVRVVGVRTGRVVDFSEELSPEIAEAVPRAAERVMARLRPVNAAAP